MKSMRPLFALCFFFETLYYINLGQRLELGEAFGMGRSLGVARVIRIACLVAWVWRGGGELSADTADRMLAWQIYTCTRAWLDMTGGRTSAV